MRVLILAGLFLSALLYFRSYEEKQLYAEVRAKDLSPKKVMTKTVPLPRDEVRTVLAAKIARPDEIVVETSANETAARELAVEESSADAEQVEVAWDEIQTKWQSELKDYLFSVDPDQAEEVFEAYLKAGKSFKEGNDEISPDEAISRHLENLKEVFGPNFQAVQDLHQEFINGLQDQSGSETQLYLHL